MTFGTFCSQRTKNFKAHRTDKKSTVGFDQHQQPQEPVYKRAGKLNAIEPIEVPRCYQITNKALRNELSALGDASEATFCALAYIVFSF